MFILSKKLYQAVQILQQAGIPITVEELRCQGVLNLTHILESTQKHAFAMKLCKLFDLSREDIVIDYILQLIVRNPQLSDVELEKIINEKRKQCDNLPYRKIALAVVELSRNRLARMLLDKEPSVEAKVQLNIKIGDYAGAVKTALRGGNPSLAHTAL